MGRSRNRCRILGVKDYDPSKDIIDVDISIELCLHFQDTTDKNSGIIEKKRIDLSYPFIKMYGEYGFDNFYIFSSLIFINTFHKDFYHTMDLHGHNKLSRWSSYPKNKPNFIDPFRDEFEKGDEVLIKILKDNFELINPESIQFANSYNKEFKTETGETIKLYIPHNVITILIGSSYRKYKLQKIGLVD